MKKALVAIAIAFLLVGAAAAQPFGQWNQPRGYMQGNVPMQMPYGYRGQLPTTLPALESVKLEGTLELVDARVAIKKDDKTYFVMIPSRLFGFIDGLKEGASVKIDGYSRAFPYAENSYVVHVNTLELNGKTIDLGLDETTLGARTGYMGMGMGMGGLQGGFGGRNGRWGR